MAHEEGVVKFRVEFTPAPALAASDIAELNAWRKMLARLQMLGQDPVRYGGYGFGNISRALPNLSGNRPFLITGTQTGEIADLVPEHFVVVDACFPPQNRIVAHGPVRPSSEAMTHGALYALDDGIQWVMHGHSPEIWHAAERLALPTTDAEVPYGTPEMSAEIERLWQESDVRERRILSMGGHEDGIVSFGRTANEAFSPLLDALIAVFAAGI